MIKRKPSDPFVMVLKNDPALLVDGLGTIRQYEKDRNLSIFDIDLEKGIMKKSGERVTLITVLPLKSESFPIIEAGTVGYKEIVRTHVVKVQNYEGVEVKINKEGKPELTDESIDNIDFESLGEIVSVICQLGSGKDGVDRAFFWEASSHVQRIQSLQLPANRARIESVESTARRSDSEPEKEITSTKS